LTARDETQSAVGEGALQLQGYIRGRRHPGLDFRFGSQDHRHRLWVDGADLGVWFGGEGHSLSQVASGLRKKIEQLEEQIETLRATGRSP
jgi:hypothetical protein